MHAGKIDHNVLPKVST